MISFFTARKASMQFMLPRARPEQNGTQQGSSCCREIMWGHAVVLSSEQQQHRENKGAMHSINNEAISRIKLKRQKAWLQLAIVVKYCVWCQLSEQVYISPFRKQLNQALLRKDMHISSWKSRPEHRRQRICAAILSIWLSRLVPEVAHTDRSGNRRGSTQVNEADFWITVASVGERKRWG